MLRFLWRVTLLGVVAGACAYALGYRWDTDVVGRERIAEVSSAARAVASKVDSEEVRKAGAEVVDRIEAGAGRAGAALAEGRLTAKIRSKIALDDTLDSAELDVETEGSVVTVSGEVRTAAQRDRAIQLARETDGVTSVVNRISLETR